MSAKWRALQHRHRFTYSAVNFPQSYMNSITQLQSNEFCQKFCTELTHLGSLNSIYSQVNHVKNVAVSFNDLLLRAVDENLVSFAAKLYLELLFLENSLSLHRTMLSVLSKNKKFWGLIGGCFRELCEEYGVLCGKGKRFCVSRVALSMMSTPKLGYLVNVVEECCVLVALDIVTGLNYVVAETNGLARPSPLVMEQCQEALSCMYYLLQRFPSRIIDAGCFQSGMVPNGSSLSEMIVAVIVEILKSSAFSRDCYVAAGVSLCAAFQVLLNPQELGYLIMEGVFERKMCSLIDHSNTEFKNALSKIPYNGDLCFELRKFSPLSRLCFIRGVLTAVSRIVLNFRFVVKTEGIEIYGADENGNRCLQSILYDCILPELCKYCENPNDIHFNFHALTVMQICLQQIKTSIMSDLVDLETEFEPIPKDLGSRVLRIIWNNLEDPLSQTVKQVHLIFDLFLDIKATSYKGDSHANFNTFLGKITADLLCLGARCKGRYAPLASLTKRLGAKTLLGMSPNLLFEVVQAYIDDDVCSAATSFLKCFLECLRDECWGSNGVGKGYEIYRGHCLPPFFYGLASGVSKLRSNLNTYALPSLLEVDVDSIFFMLSFLSIGVLVDTGLVLPELSCLGISFGIEQKVAVLVSLLKVSRSLALFDGDIESSHNLASAAEECKLEEEHALIYLKGIPVNIPAEWLALALTHVDESLRVDAAETLFLSPKTASLPSALELNLMRVAVPLNMRCCSTAFQMKWASIFKKFFSRVRTTLERQIKQRTWKPSDWEKNDISSPYKSGDAIIVSRADNLYNFMKWLSCFLYFSCYPSAPYERKIMAMELIMIMVNVWSIVPPLEGNFDVLSTENLYIFSEGLTRPDSTMLLVGSIIDSWDRLRESSFRILLSFPTPLPGISSENKVQEVILWAKKLVCSPRVRESDAGALALRLIFRKYVLDLGWIIGASGNVTCHKPEAESRNEEHQSSESKLPLILYINSLIDWLQAAAEEGEKDLFEACKNSFAHGVLLALRYAFEELDWNCDVAMSGIPEMRGALGKLLELVMRITTLALGVVSADAWHLPQDMDDIEEDSFLLECLDEIVMPSSVLECEAKDLKEKEDVRPAEQIVMVGCWLAMKEVSLLLGTIIRKIPLPVATSIGEGSADAAMDHLLPTSDAVLDVSQLEVIGNHFLEVLLKMKHNGAIDKTRAGFTALCNRLLCSDDPRLCQLTESWMEQLMERTVAKGQTVDDLLRRSAGIPAAFSAFFLSEPQGSPKKLLPQALRWLIELASGSLLDQAEPNIVDKLQNKTIGVSDGENGFMQRNDINENLTSAKIRVEGVIPTVHAFNVLKAAFNDANLATDTSGFAAEAMIISIRSFSSPHWEIRNSACLAYTALVRRMVGFLNVHKRDSARRALTSLEFFHRYPLLHSFVSNELKVATEFLLGGQSNSNLASIVHPSLCPVLILLSRLKPSPIASEAGYCLDPFLFMPYIQRCSTQKNMRIRVLASRALTGLVSNEKLHLVLLDIASGLPNSVNQTEATHNRCARSSVQFNAIHGKLLQLSALLDANCRNLADFSMKDMILYDLIKTLNKCSWIGNPTLCSCPILNASFLKVLDHMLSIAGTRQASKNYDVICSLLSKLSSDCLVVESESSFHDPTAVELRKQAAISYFHSIYLYEDHAVEISMPNKSSPAIMLNANSSVDNGSGGVEGRLTCYMSDASYEVRLATLKWLIQFIKTTAIELGDDQNGSDVAIAHWAKANLQTTLIRLLSSETNHKCRYYILRIIFAWNLLHFQKSSDKCSGDNVYIGEMDFDSVVLFWNKLVSIHDSVRHTKTLEALICCFGLCIKRFAGFLCSILPNVSNGKPEEVNRCALLCGWIEHFVCLIKQYSDASQQINLRKAAAESVVASGLLEQAEFISSFVTNGSIPSENCEQQFEPLNSANMLGDLLLDIWFTCIKLLEDEDVFIRKELALEVQKCFPPKFRGRTLAVVVPAQVERVLELCFEFLSLNFGHWDRYFDYLLRWISDSVSYVVPKDDLVRRVFDKEIDNYHEEKLLICQICCSSLENLKLSTTQGPKLLTYLRKWRGHFFRQLSVACEHIRKLEGDDWIGGVGNHRDAFLPLYGNLLGFYVLSKYILHAGVEDSMCLLSDVVELKKSIRPFLTNPLICNLYIVVVRLHEDMVVASANHMIPDLLKDIQIWDSFNPYFLLR
ncbi:thyroid adenoma-associated protein homolog [Chenopodium quinoa]|uniref:DUF2428 domain-containing protein n=1 Tax=Chenopodium quinoa TaxID=63459 RepID=A0A803N3H7_CHEQI|nr:thyroid adenoma-associated protein homolog [Chenopodium quinoa]